MVPLAQEKRSFIGRIAMPSGSTNGADHAAQLDQVVPIAAVPRQARRFDTEDRTHLACADFRDESLESGSLHQTRSRAPEILVNDHDLLEA